MTKPKSPEPVDPKAAVTEVFKRLGGIQAMTAWGRTHKTLFYSLYCKLFNAPAVQANVNVRVESDATAAQLALENALTRMIAARKSEHGAVFVDGERVSDGTDTAATARAGAVVIEHEPRAVERVINSQAADGRPHTADGRPQPGLQKSHLSDHPKDDRPQSPAAASNSVDNVVRLTPRAAAVPAQEPRAPSSTELFYEYHGTRRPYWGPIGSGGPP
jgi:hypothetical protein